MKKKNLCTLILSCLMLLLSVQTVFADAIWAPMDDFFDLDFDPEKEQSCVYNHKQYTVYSKVGETIAMQTPLSEITLRSYENGTDLVLPWICMTEDGQSWGAIRSVRLPSEASFTEDWQGKSGYVKMDDLLLSYGYDAFAEEHGAEFTDYSGQIDMQSIEGFTVWSYPGSELIMLEADRELIDYLIETPSWELYKFADTWTDNEGHIWAAIELQRPNMNGWINLSDPAGTTPDKISDGFDWVDTTVDTPAIPEGAEAISDVDQLMGDWRSQMIYIFPEHQTSIDFAVTITQAEGDAGLKIQNTYGNLSYDGQKMVPEVKGKSVSYDASFTDGVLDVFDGVNQHKTFFWKLDGVLYGESISQTPDKDYSRQINAFIR